MVYIASWLAYQEAAEALYAKSPSKTRYCVKWRPTQGRLVLKITDDTTCIKFRTSSSIYLNRFEALNLVLMQKMQNRCADPTPPPPAAGLGAELGPGSATASRAASPMPQTQAGVVGGGTKKKKAKKKK